ALNQVVLEYQRFEFGVGDDELDVIDLRGEPRRLERSVGGRAVPVGAHPVPEVNRLADVNDRAGQVLHNITARPGGERVQLFVDVLRDAIITHGAHDSTFERRTKDGRWKS